MQVSNFRVTLQSDNGKHSLTTSASSAEAAKAKVIAAENCPPSAVLSVKALRLNKYAYSKVLQVFFPAFGCWEDISEHECNSRGIVKESAAIELEKSKILVYRMRVIFRKTLRQTSNA